MAFKELETELHLRACWARGKTWGGTISHLHGTCGEGTVATAAQAHHLCYMRSPSSCYGCTTVEAVRIAKETFPLMWGEAGGHWRLQLGILIEQVTKAWGGQVETNKSWGVCITGSGIMSRLHSSSPPSKPKSAISMLPDSMSGSTLDPVT